MEEDPFHMISVWGLRGMTYLRGTIFCWLSKHFFLDYPSVFLFPLIASTYFHSKFQRAKNVNIRVDFPCGRVDSEDARVRN
jgi:hypothetical protein